ncbi:MAG: 4Fe-4S dicluster domain-containing protein [Coriobacteriia bacterium]|nr:4Fe-4S dicluster domain-containing protein [Coriobacteriia bacterium]
MSDKAFLFDASRCTGCKGCQIACKCWNNLPSSLEMNHYKFTGSYQNPADLNGDTRLIMTFNEFENKASQKRVGNAITRRSCQHCTDAGCVSICPAGALFKDEATGLVTHDASKCVGCQYCSSACPFEVPRYTDDGLRTVINKCYGCVDRVANGMAPACVTTCQPEALLFGDRADMIAQAHRQVAFLKEHGYEDACVYGENEMGGLHVIQVLKYGVEKHGQVENPQVMGTVGAMNVMKPLTGVVAPLVVVGLGAMFALATGYKRNTLAYNNETQDTIALETGEVVKTGDPQDSRTFTEALTENLPFMEANRKKKQLEAEAAAKAAAEAEAAAGSEAQVQAADTAAATEEDTQEGGE